MNNTLIYISTHPISLDYHKHFLYNMVTRSTYMFLEIDGIITAYTYENYNVIYEKDYYKIFGANKKHVDIYLKTIEKTYTLFFDRDITNKIFELTFKNLLEE